MESEFFRQSRGVPDAHERSTASTHPQGACTPERAPSIIVGLGNEIAGDDGVGIHVAHLLQDRLRDRADVEVVALPWAGFSLLDQLAGRLRALIVDCLVTGERPPGTVVRVDVEGLAGSVRLNSFHDISFPTAMSLGRAMGWEMPDEVAIWGVEAHETEEFREGLSPAVAAAVDPLINDVIQFLESDGSRLEPMGVMR